MRPLGWLERWAGNQRRQRSARVPASVADASGPLSPEQIKLLLNSVPRIAATPDESGKIFYDRLFAVAPEVRGLFPDDMATQQRKLIQTLVWVVENLGKPEKTAEKVGELGRRHAGYGVEDEHYEAVGGALLYMIEDRLGADFTPEVRAAWFAAYDDVANRMRRVAADTDIRQS